MINFSEEMEHLRRQRGLSDKERFEAKTMPEPNSGCWLWLSSLNDSGYGYVCLPGGVSKLASRYAIELYTGQAVPAGLLACHRCDNKICVNPDHLYVGTHQDNMADAHRRSWLGKWIFSGKKKLVASQVVEIRGKLLAGATIKSLALEYGVHTMTIKSIKSRKTCTKLEASAVRIELDVFGSGDRRAVRLTQA